MQKDPAVPPRFAADASGAIRRAVAESGRGTENSSAHIAELRELGRLVALLRGALLGRLFGRTDYFLTIDHCRTFSKHPRMLPS